jgi:small multidrug resistance family-3 protein
MDVLKLDIDLQQQPFVVAVNNNTDDVTPSAESTAAFTWTAVTVIQSLFLFAAAGVAEIVGGWFVWMALHGNFSGKRPWWFALLGSFVLIVYGFIPCFPTDSFGRIYAAYGGFFIVLSFLFGWALDGDRPDIGDVVGGSIAMVGVCVIMFWPR